MAIQTLTTEKIKAICNSAEGQAEVAKFAETMNNQGVIKMFIDFPEVRNLIRRMINDGIIPDSGSIDEYSDENFMKDFIALSTKKMNDYLCRVENIDKKPAEHGLPMLREMANIYFVYPYRPMFVFYWMSEFAIPFREAAQKAIYFHFTVVNYNPDKYDKYMELIDRAFPMGIKSEVKAQSWVKANEKEYKQLDFSEIFASIPFDRYYVEAFEQDVREDKGHPEFGTRFMMASEAEIKAKADEVFKPLVLNEVFPELKNLEVETINAGIKKFFAEKPALVYMLYSRAMFFVKAGELERLQKEFMKFFDENGIDYSLESNAPPHPMMFHKMPWESGTPS